MSQEDKFLSSFQPATQIFNKHIQQDSLVRIITHNDADGLSSGGILSVAVHRKGARFRTTSEKKLDDKLIQNLVDEDPDLIIFSDFGSAYIDLIADNLKQDVIVLDHHLPSEREADNIIQINPMLYEIDGARELSASGISYFFAKNLDPKNIDLSCLGLVGALGDQQDRGDQKSLTGMNTIIEQDAIENGYLQKHVGLIFYGYETRPLPKAIAYTTIPFIPGLSGDEGSCVAFLNRIGVPLSKGDRMRALSDLTDEEKRVLFSALSSHMISTGCDAKAVHQLIGNIYTFKLEEKGSPLRSGREYGTLLNACGRMGNPGVGISICLGDRGDAMNEASDILDEYRRKIGASLDWVQKNNKVEELENIYLIRAGDNIDDTIIGVVSGILLGQGILKNPKPIIATAISDDDQIKVSARGIEELVKKGLHLGVVMKKAAEECGGGGGGHDIAAGAYVPIDKEEQFIAKVNKLVPEHITQ